MHQRSRFIQAHVGLGEGIIAAVTIVGTIYAVTTFYKSKKDSRRLERMEEKVDKIIANQNSPNPKDPKKSMASGNGVKYNKRITLQVFKDAITEKPA
jgi:hypothetical protein